MRLLILGGTWFLGRTLAEMAVARGWEVTTFSRGLHGRDVADTSPVRGRREVSEDVTRLARSGDWDAVVDTSGYTPEVVELAAQTLRGHAELYVLISSVNAYRGWPAVPLTDESQTYQDVGDAAVPLPLAAEIPALDVAYGQKKAASERVVERIFGLSASLVLRPGVILGPYEYIGRLPWLLRRMEHGGEVLAGGPPSRPIQPVDVRDLAMFIMKAATTGVSGTMNVTAPLDHATYGELLNGCCDVTGAVAELVWLDEDWLSAQQVTPWTEVPLWRTAPGAWHVSSARALGAGLTCRPLGQTIADTWDWLRREEPVPHQRAAEIGMDPQKERQVLAAWREHLAGRQDRS